MKERKKVAAIGLGVAFVLLGLELLVNYRVYYQVVGGWDESDLLMSGYLQYVSYYLVFSVFGYFGIKWTMWVLQFVVWALIILYCGHALYKPDADNRLRPLTVVVAIAVTVVYFVLVYVSPFQAALSGARPVNFFLYMGLMAATLAVMFGNYTLIGKKFVFWPDDDEMEKSKDDPFGRLERVFPQQTKKIENKYSVNIPFEFLGKKGVVKGWLNLINMFRAVLIMGTPGSGKSFGTFLPAIYQMIHKGFTMLIYDFKFKELTEYGYHCYLDMIKRREELGKSMGKKLWEAVFGEMVVPEFCVISLENPMYSERCNVFQPHLLKDFSVDAYGLIKNFFIALNPSWKNKEGDFFPESAMNVASAGVWGLKLYKPLDGRPQGSFCTLPHLIEFMSQDVDSVIRMMVMLKDQSLVNVIKPFEEAQRDNALEQLQGQMGTVRITLSRLTSPMLYFMLTEKVGEEPFDLKINSPKVPKILCLANSGQNQGVNNIVLSLFITQIFRFINRKHQRPVGIMLDEAVTLSFPKGTLDTLIATGRSHLCAVWVGIQDKAQLVRDFGRESAEAIIKMIGNVITGQVFDDTAKMISERIGDVMVNRRTTSISAEGERSFSISLQPVRAVPESFISTMSQGTMAGMLADEFGSRSELKPFYGDVKFEHPFKEKVKKDVVEYKDGEYRQVEKEVEVDMDLPGLPYSKYWRKVIERECKGMDQKGIEEFVQKEMQENFRQVIYDIARMRADLLGTPVDTAVEEFEEAKRRGMAESDEMIKEGKAFDPELKPISDEEIESVGEEYEYEEDGSDVEVD